MGFESFRVELRGGQATHAEADECVRRLPGATPDPDERPLFGSTFYRITDGLHVLEAEVVAVPPRISLRFTLCHPPSVDAALLAVMRELMGQLGMSAIHFEANLPEERRTYSQQELKEFADVVSHHAELMRVGWKVMFGEEQRSATTREAFEHFILPRCQPLPPASRGP